MSASPEPRRRPRIGIVKPLIALVGTGAAGGALTSALLVVGGAISGIVSQMSGGPHFAEGLNAGILVGMFSLFITVPAWLAGTLVVGGPILALLHGLGLTRVWHFLIAGALAPLPIWIGLVALDVFAASSLLVCLMLAPLGAIAGWMIWKLVYGGEGQ